MTAYFWPEDEKAKKKQVWLFVNVNCKVTVHQKDVLKQTLTKTIRLESMTRQRR